MDAVKKPTSYKSDKFSTEPSRTCEKIQFFALVSKDMSEIARDCPRMSLHPYSYSLAPTTLRESVTILDWYQLANCVYKNYLYMSMF